MNKEELLNDIANNFRVVKRQTGKLQCKCPAHNDKQASLTISLGNKCVLFYCHAGCELNDILSAAGIEKKNTYYDNEPKQANWKAYVEAREKKRIEAVYNYVSSINGSYVFTKIRLVGKKLLYGVLENERFSYGLSRNTPRKSLKAIYGDVKAINKAISDEVPIFIPEGEKDVDTLTKQGYVAFTYGGVNDWQSDFSLLLKNAIDCDKIVGKYTVRTRCTGDSIRLKNRGCTKNLTKLYNECNIPVDERDVIPVIADEKGVIWIYGIGVAHRCAISDKSKKILMIKTEKDKG